MGYKAVIFDLFGTLVNKFPVDESVDVLREMAAVLSVPPDEFIQLWFDSFNERHSGCFPNLEADIEYVCSKLGIRPEVDQTGKAARINLDYVAAHIAPKQGAVELLTSLRDKNCKTGLVSNWSDEVPTVWQDIPLSKYFDVSVFSCKAGMMKPDPRIYRMAAEQLSIEPGNCLYIGDGDSSELAGASEAGMRAVLLEDTDTNTSSGDEREEWAGAVISSLDEIMGLLE